MVSTAYDAHLRKSARSYERFEEPEDPREEAGHVDEEFARLMIYERKWSGVGDS